MRLFDCVQNVRWASFRASDVSRSSTYVDVFSSDEQKEVERYNSSKSVDYIKPDFKNKRLKKFSNAASRLITLNYIYLDGHLMRPSR